MFNVSPPGRCGPPQCVNDLTPLLSFVDDDVLARAVNFKAIYTLTELNASPTHLRFSEPLSGTTPSHLPYLLVSVYVIILREPFHYQTFSRSAFTSCGPKTGQNIDQLVLPRRSLAYTRTERHPVVHVYAVCTFWNLLAREGRDSYRYSSLYESLALSYRWPLSTGLLPKASEIPNAFVLGRRVGANDIFYTAFNCRDRTIIMLLVRGHSSMNGHEQLYSIRPCNISFISPK